MEIRLLFLFFLFATSAKAQTFTYHLTRRAAGEGVVILHQDAEIEALVNAQRSQPTAPHNQKSASSNHVTHSSSASGSTHPSAHGEAVEGSMEQTTAPVAVRRMRTSGYRIQIYAGGNNRQAKSEAYHMASLARSTFGDVNVYTNFISPRWTCRVGDFKTQEEAAEMLQRIRETQKFNEASIVKSSIIVVY